VLPVTAHLELRLVLGAHRALTVKATLTYDDSNPYAVTAAFHTDEGDITWIFGRDLLRDGLLSPVGDGDVAIWPTHQEGHEALCLSLSSPTGSALLEGDISLVREFLDEAYLRVPSGRETIHLDVDGALADLLGDGTSPHS
jgi:hypothetical protein